MHCWQEWQLVRLLWKTVWRFLERLKVEIPYSPVIPLPVNYLKKTKTLIQKDLCAAMLTAALFIVAKLWKQPKDPLMDKRIKKRWCVDTHARGNITETEKRTKYCHS